MTVRPAALSDAADIAALSGVLGYPVHAVDMAARLSQLLACETLPLCVTLR